MADEQAPPLNLLRPLYLMSLSAAYIPVTIFSLVTTFQFDKLTSWTAFQHAWFGRFWSYFGPLAAESAAPKVEPLLHHARGIVLDIGPGSGQWLYLFAQAKNKNIKKIYGVEPNSEHHKALRNSIHQAGLEGVYEILPVGVENLESCGIEKGTIDTIATIQVLCSVPGPEKIIKELYPYLRAGGIWLVYEHVKTKYPDHFVGYWQPFINLIWPHFFDGCCVVRPSDEWLLQAGEWESVDLKPGPGEGPYATLPHVIGTLIKTK